MNMDHRIVFRLFVIIALVSATQAQKEPKPLPDNYILSWTLYTIPLAENEPPFPNNPQNIPPAPYTAGRGMTYYDWSIKYVSVSISENNQSQIYA